MCSQTRNSCTKAFDSRSRSTHLKSKQSSSGEGPGLSRCTLRKPRPHEINCRWYVCSAPQSVFHRDWIELWLKGKLSCFFVRNAFFLVANSRRSLFQSFCGNFVCEQIEETEPGSKLHWDLSVPAFCFLVHGHEWFQKWTEGPTLLWSHNLLPAPANASGSREPSCFWSHATRKTRLFNQSIYKMESCAIAPARK